MLGMAFEESSANTGSKIALAKTSLSVQAAMFELASSDDPNTRSRISKAYYNATGQAFELLLFHFHLTLSSFVLGGRRAGSTADQVARDTLHVGSPG